MKMSEALDLYLSIKGKGRDKRFFAYAKRAIGYLFDAVSDKPIASYTRSDANALRDMLIKRGLVVSSVKRNFEVVRAIFNVANDDGFAADLFKGHHPVREDSKPDAIEVEILVSQVTRDGKVVNKSMKQITKVISFKGERLVAEDYEIGSASDFYPELDDLFSSKSEDDD